ncbi:MAG: Calx-beta domain-containing protein [Fuerstiella sp.]
MEQLEDRALLTATDLFADAIYELAPGDDPTAVPLDETGDAHGHSENEDGDAFQFDDLDRWTRTATDGSGLGQGDPTTLTWSFVADGTSITGGREGTSASDLIAFLDGIYGNVTPDTDYTDEVWFPVFEAYLNRWGEVSGLTYIYEPNDDGSQIINNSGSASGVTGVRGDLRIGGHSIDGQSGSNVLAYNYFPNHGDMVIDTDNISFYSNLSNSSRALRNVLAHEHGHGIGIGHVCPLLGGADGRLMEPFVNLSFDGPQLDDILATQRGYGDALEKNGGNDTAGTAFNLGTLTDGSLLAIGTDAADARVSPTETDFVSIDDDSDIDFYRFTVNTALWVNLRLTPLGPTYLSGAQNPDGSCSAGTPFDTSRQSDLTLTLYDTNGTTVLQTSNVNGLGGNEEILNELLTAGTYFAGITGSANAIQAYELNIDGQNAADVSVIETGGGTSVSENLTTDTFSVALAVQPTSDVVIQVSNGNPAEVAVDVSSLTFTSGNWNIPQTVTVTGRDDSIVDGDVLVPVTLSIDDALSDDAFDTVPDQIVNVTNVDNDTAFVSIVASDNGSEVGPVDGLFTVTQTTAAAADTVLSYSVGGTAAAGSDFTSLSGTVTISAGSTSATIPVPVIDDARVEPTETVVLTLTGITSSSPGVFLARVGLDPSFGTDGVTQLPSNMGWSPRNIDLAVQPNGKIVVTGATHPTDDDVWRVLRYEADGTLDPTFGTGGIVDETLGGVARSMAIEILPNGDILVAGQGSGGGVLALYQPDGTPVTSFGTGGAVVSSELRFRDMVVDSLGRIYVIGTQGSCPSPPATSHRDIEIRRFLPDGTLDTTYGGPVPGSVRIDMESNVRSCDEGYSLAVLPDDRIVATGSATLEPGTAAEDRDFAVARLNTDGSLDTSFAGDGTLTIDLGENEIAQDLRVQPDGKLVLVGSLRDASFNAIAYGVVRLTTDGVPDTTFDGDGIAVVPVTGFNDIVNDVAIQSDGKLILAGETQVSPWQNYTFVRLNTDGSLDTSFDDDGILILPDRPSPNHPDEIFAVRLQPDGRLLAVGGGGSTGGSHYEIMRLNTETETAAINILSDDTTVTTDNLDNTITLRVSSTDPQITEIDVDGAVVGSFARSTPTITINAGDGDDTFIIDYVNGNPIPTAGVVLNGEANTTTLPGDQLELRNGTAGSVEHLFDSASDGSIDVDGSVITYTGLEPIRDHLEAADRVFTFAATSDDITLGDDGTAGNGISRISSVSSSETVDFLLPASSLTVNAGDGSDVISIQQLDQTFAGPGSGLVKDTTFGSGGIVIQDLGDSDQVDAAVLDSTGGIIVTGSGRTGDTGHLTRLHADGSLDVSLQLGTSGTAGAGLARHGTDGVLLAFNKGTLPFAARFTIPSAAGTPITLILNGDDGDDTFIVDYDEGDPVPQNGLFVHGGNNGAGASGDQVVLQNGSVSTVTHNFTNSSDGTIDVDGAVITYTGLEPIADNLAAVDRVFSFGATADEILLTDDGIPANDISRLSSLSSSETVDFLHPSGSLTVNAGDGSDTIEFQSLDSGIPQLDTLTFDFEDLAHTGVRTFLGPYQSNGFTFRSDTIAQETTWIVYGTTAATRYVGSAALNSNWEPVTLTLSKDDGSPFNLVSMDISEWDSAFPGVISVTFTGTLAGGGTVSQTFTSDGIHGMEPFSFVGFNQVTQVDWDYTELSNRHHFDNVVVQVPSAAPPSILSVNLNGQDGADSFDVTPSRNSVISVDGGNPTVAPGDTLAYHGAGIDDSPGTRSGTVTQTGFPDLAYNDIEDLIFPPAEVTLSVSTNVVAESDSAATRTITVTASTNVPVQGDQTVELNISGTGITSGDYTLSGTTITIPANTTSGTVTLTVQDDAVVELTETTFLTISSPSAGIVLGTAFSVVTIHDDDSAVVSIDDVSQDENDGGQSTFIFTVSVDRAVDVPWKVDYTTVDGTATIGDSDFSGTSGTINFSGTANETHTIAVNVFGDLKVEQDETFFLDLLNINAVGRDVRFGNDRGSGEVLNDDTATVTLAPLTATADEGTGGTSTDLTFSVSLNNAVQGGFDVAYTTSDDTATVADGDYVDNDGTLTFAGVAGEVQTITVRVSHDAKVEGDELFALALGALSNLAAGIDPADVSATGSPQAGTILNDDAATVTLTPLVAAVDEGTGGTTTDMTFSVTLNNAVQGGFDLAYATSDGTATVADIDYVDNDGSLAFVGTAGEARTITVQVHHDAKVEADELFTVTLEAVSNLAATVDPSRVLIAGSPQTGTILNDDTATVTLAPLTATADEGTGGTTTDLTYSVTLSNAVQGGFDLAYTTSDDTATVADGDYIDNDGSQSFAGLAGEIRTITVQVNHDAKVEADELFVLALEAVSNLAGAIDPASLSITGNPQIGTIVNDDAATISIDDISTDEGDAGTTTLTFTATLTGEVSQTVSADYALAADTAAAIDGDYTDQSGTLVFGPVPGVPVRTATVSVQVVGDEKIELDETFLVNLFDISAGGLDVSFADSQGRGTIRNDDSATISVDDVGVVEADAGSSNLTFTVSIDGEVDTPVRLNFSTGNSTASVADSDFLFTAGTLEFLPNAGPGPQTLPVTVAVTGDRKVELDETFFLNLQTLQTAGRTVTLADDQGLGTIINDDSASLTISDVTAEEGAGGLTEFQFDVVLSGIVDVPVAVDYATAPDSADDADLDFVARTGTLSFPAGSTADSQTLTVVVQVTGDSRVELDEMFRLNLTGMASGGRNVTLDDVAGIGTIINDDHAVLSIRGLAAAEGDTGDTPFLLTLSLDRPVDVPVSVDFATIIGTASDVEGDFSATSGRVDIAADNLTATLSVAVTGDYRIESDEQFTVGLSALAADGRSVSISTTPGLVTILNDDHGILDIDDNQVVDAATDGILILRYLFGFRGTALTDGAIGQSAANNTPAGVEGVLDSAQAMLDVDGNGVSDAATDGILILRYLFGFRDDALVNGAIGPGATRTTGPAVSAFLDSFNPLAPPPVTLPPAQVSDGTEDNPDDAGSGVTAPFTDSATVAESAPRPFAAATAPATVPAPAVAPATAEASTSTSTSTSTSASASASGLVPASQPLQPAGILSKTAASYSGAPTTTNAQVPLEADSLSGKEATRHGASAGGGYRAWIDSISAAESPDGLPASGNGAVASHEGGPTAATGAGKLQATLPDIRSSFDSMRNELEHNTSGPEDPESHVEANRSADASAADKNAAVNNAAVKNAADKNSADDRFADRPRTASVATARPAAMMPAFLMDRLMEKWMADGMWLEQTGEATRL